MGETGGQGGQGVLGGGSRNSRNEAHAPGAATVVQIGHVAGGVNVAVPAQGAVVPRQVPAPPVSFVDRADVLAWMSGQVADPGQPPRIAVLAGLAGIGKRAAARRWAHLSRDRFPGGDLHVDCAEYGAGAGEGTADVSGMVGACLRGLGADDRFTPASLMERVRLLRTRTSAAPVLVVVENATEPGQVLPLVPGAPGSLVLVTSCADLGELHLEGAGFYEVQGLDDGSGAELLATVCGTERIAGEHDVAGSLVRWCAGMPIALAVLAARLAGTRSLTMAELAAELSDERRRLPGLALGGRAMVSAVFTAAYERLPGQARRLYRLLGVLPCTDVSADAAAAAAGTVPGQARAALDSLVSAHLAEYPGNGRYGLHDLARLHARERAQQEDPPAVLEDALRAVVRHYVAWAAFADRAVMGDRARAADHGVLLAGHDDPFPGPEPARQALAWLDAERANLVPVTEAAAASGWDAEAWQLAEALTGYYFNHRHLADWVTVSGAGARAAQACGNVKAEARLRMTVSRAFTDLGELGRAQAELDAAASLAERSGDLVLQASAWEFRGRYLDVADPPQALGAYRRSHDLNVAAGERRGAALALYFGGCALQSAGQHRQALEELGRALGTLRGLGDRRMAGRVLIAIGTAQSALGRDGEAAASLREAVGLVSGLHYEAQAWEALAAVASQAGDHGAARQCLQAALRVYASSGHPRAEAISEQLAAGPS
jgi:tetratricopeptide (TPR) repeat protein